MKRLTILLILATSISVIAQQRRMPPPLHDMPEETKKEINEQVWQPFLESYKNLDAEQFMSVQSTEIVRVMGSMKRIYDHTKYSESINRMFGMMKSRNAETRLELSFTSRMLNDDMAYEVGYYRLKSKGQDGEYKSRGFGFFHVMLKQEEGSWKITMDSDTDADIDEQTFLAGEVLAITE